MPGGSVSPRLSDPLSPPLPVRSACDRAFVKLPLVRGWCIALPSVESTRLFLTDAHLLLSTSRPVVSGIFFSLHSGYTSETCAVLFAGCPDRRVWMIVASALSLLLLLFLVGLLLLRPSGTAATTASRAVSATQLALWSAGVGVANSPSTNLQATSTLWGAVLALAAAGVLAWDAWALVLS